MIKCSSHCQLQLQHKVPTVNHYLYFPLCQPYFCLCVFYLLCLLILYNAPAILTGMSECSHDGIGKEISFEPKKNIFCIKMIHYNKSIKSIQNPSIIICPHDYSQNLCHPVIQINTTKITKLVWLVNYTWYKYKWLVCSCSVIRNCVK